MAPSSCSIGSLSLGGVVASKDDHEWRKKRDELNKDDEVMALMRLLMDEMPQEDDLQCKLHKMSRGKLSQGIIGFFTRLCAHGETIAELKKNLEMFYLII